LDIALILIGNYHDFDWIEIIPVKFTHFRLAQIIMELIDWTISKATENSSPFLSDNGDWLRAFIRNFNWMRRITWKDFNWMKIGAV